MRAAKVCAAGALALLASCALNPSAPGRYTIDDRLANIPSEELRTHAPAEILWSDRQVPFIVAQNDHDAAYLLGVAHAHLREGQMELLRRAARGRLSESAGGLASDLDALVRTLDLDRAVPEMAEILAPQTRLWIQAYVDGVNDFVRERPDRPSERWLINATEIEPWTVEDVLALGRLASVDITWGRLFREARLKDDEKSAAYLERIRQYTDNGQPSFGPDEPTPLAPLFAMARTGSNSFAVSGDRSTSGGAMIASDPHLGVLQPNLFCIVGYRTPAGAVAGLTFAGIPFVVIGRNEHIAWGGTNMQALSSVFYDVEGDSAEAFSERVESIGRRWWFDKKVSIREHSLGPVVTDNGFFRNVDVADTALWWRGHEPSDEASAFLGISRASNWDEFRKAFETYAVSGQNYVYADGEGNIGQLMAVEFDLAAGRAAEDGPPVDPVNPSYRPGERLTSSMLPSTFNPASGIVVTANNTPVRTEPPVAVGGNSDDRTVRIRKLLDSDALVSLDQMRAAQRDVYLISAHEAAQSIVERSQLPAGAFGQTLREWDGHYRADSSGALAYQYVAAALIESHYRSEYGDYGASSMRGSTAAHRFIEQDVTSGAIDDEALQAAISTASEHFKRGDAWGDKHRLIVRHPASFAPIFGGRFKFADLPASGTSGTVNKAANSITMRRHSVTFGAQSRHVSDMASLDENYFVLLGGQDGWFGSSQLIDQVPLWQAGEMVHVPLSEESVRSTFTRRMIFGDHPPRAD